MREPYTQLYLHAVWSTWDRLPLIQPEWEGIVHRTVQQQASLLGTDVIAIGGIEDHVHVLLRFTPTVALARLIGRMKGASSRVAEQVSRRPFRWQGGYGAFTVGKRGVPTVRAYVLGQIEHHRDGSLIAPLEIVAGSRES